MLALQEIVQSEGCCDLLLPVFAPQNLQGGPLRAMLPIIRAHSCRSTLIVKPSSAANKLETSLAGARSAPAVQGWLFRVSSHDWLGCLVKAIHARSFFGLGGRGQPVKACPFTRLCFKGRHSALNRSDAHA